MTLQKYLKPTALALAISIINTAHAYDFKVGETTASIYGYAKLDIIYDVNDKLGLTSGRGTAARLDGEAGSDGHFDMHAYQSRLGFSTSTPVSGSTLRTVIEGDFYGGGNGGLRLRHAYGEWNGILAGQTWTNFYGMVAGTPTIDFEGVGGHPLGHRQAQFRYTNENFAVALEDPDDRGGQVDAIGAKNRLPDLTIRYTDGSGPIKYSASAVARYLEYDTAGQLSPASDDSALGWGFGLEAAMDITAALTVRAGLTHGDGIGGYINGNPKISPAFVDENGTLQTIRATGGTLGATLKAGPGSINVAYSRMDSDLDDNPAYLTHNDTFEEWWANYIWSPAERISYGIEASWHRREQTDGDEGDALRLQGMVMYSF